MSNYPFLTTLTLTRAAAGATIPFDSDSATPPSAGNHNGTDGVDIVIVASGDPATTTDTVNFSIRGTYDGVNYEELGALTEASFAVSVDPGVTFVAKATVQWAPSIKVRATAVAGNAATTFTIILAS